MEKHKKTSRDEKWDLTGISSHSQFCDAGFDWRNVRILKVKERKFNRKVEKTWRSNSRTRRHTPWS